MGLTFQVFFWTSLTFTPLSYTFPCVPPWFIFPCIQPVGRGGAPSGPAFLIFCIWFPVHSFPVSPPPPSLHHLRTADNSVFADVFSVSCSLQDPSLPCWSSAASHGFLLWYMFSLSFLPSHFNLKSVFALFLSISSWRSPPSSLLLLESLLYSFRRMLPYPFFFFFFLISQIFILSPWSGSSCQAVCTDSMSLCSITVADILLENVPCSFPPHQAPVSQLHMAPRGLLLPCTRHGLDCLFYKDSPSLFLLENTWQVANPSPSLPCFCFTRTFPRPNPKPVCCICWRRWCSVGAS